MTYSQPQKPIGILAEGEVWALVRACSRYASSGRQDACLIGLCAFAGLRTAEALALLPTQIRKNGEDSLEVVNLTGKGDLRRTVHVLPGREKPILDWLDYRRRLDIPKCIQVDGRRVAPSLICSISQPDPGQPLDGSNTRKMLKRRTQSAGIDERVHMHDLRHFHAFQLAQHGVKLHYVQQRLGHSRLDTTSTYIANLSAKGIGDEIRRAFGLERSMSA